MELIITMDDNYIHELDKRNDIMKKVYLGEKITKEERIWLYTHSLYNTSIDFPCFNICVESLVQKTSYKVVVKINDINFPENITPFFSVPDKKGFISCDDDVINYKGDICSGNKIYGLAWKKLEKNTVYTFGFYSATGYISIGYECNYFDVFSKIYKREASSTGNMRFAFIREKLNDNSFRYQCKAPFTDSFDALVFTVEFQPLSGKQSGDSKRKQGKTGDGSVSCRES